MDDVAEAIKPSAPMETSPPSPSATNMFMPLLYDPKVIPVVAPATLLTEYSSGG